MAVMQYEIRSWRHYELVHVIYVVRDASTGGTEVETNCGTTFVSHEKFPDRSYVHKDDVPNCIRCLTVKRKSLHERDVARQ